jgi:UDP-N-acetyl-D-mannosaminuronic acid dehydrogenase
MKKKIVVVGTGYVGLPAALMWAKEGLPVVGVDINENIVKAINERTLLLNEDELNELLNDATVKQNLSAQTTPCEGDVFVIAVPTPVHHLKKVGDLSYVKSAIQSIAPFLRKGNLIIVESTIPPLTTREFVKPLVEELTGLSVPGDILLAHCPERILPGDIFKEIIWNDRLIGGINEDSTNAAEEVYKYFVKGSLYRCSDLVAELSKLMENTYRDVNIALANELSQICEDLNVEVGEVITYANKHPRVNILSPGIGVGGHCIPVDPWFLKEVAPYNSRLITMARLVNDEMPHKMAMKVRKAVRDVDNPKIIALGASYKRNCEDIRESPALEIVQMLKADGYDIQHFDPLVHGMTYTNLKEIAVNADLLLVLVSHDEIRKELEKEWDGIKSVMRNPGILILDKY